MNIALKLTIFRVVLIPLYLFIFFFDFPFANWLAWGVFAVASFTDYLDGYYARKYNQSTALGAMLDPVADKLLVAVVLVSLVWKHSEGWEGVFIMISTVIIIGREILISALREFMSGLNIRSAVAVQYIGKVKTTAQIFALGFLIIYKDVWGIPTKEIGWALLFVASVLTVWSMLDYFKSAIVSLKDHNIDIYK